jgi:hypothetical protein
MNIWSQTKGDIHVFQTMKSNIYYCLLSKEEMEIENNLLTL